MIQIIGGEVNIFYDFYFYGVIYLLKNKVNNKVYIGKTKQNIFDYIKNKFKYETNKSKIPIVRAVLKYGEESFECKVIDCFRTLKDLNEAERKYIREFDSRNPLVGYNISEGGDGGPLFKGYHHTEKTKKKMSKNSAHCIPPTKGKTLPDEWKENIRIALNKVNLKGKKKGPQSKDHIEKCRLSKMGDKNPAKRQEVRQKISKSKKGKLPHNKGKKLIIENGRRKYVQQKTC